MKKIVGIIPAPILAGLVGLCLVLSGLETSAKDKKEKTPKGLKTKTEIAYKFVYPNGHKEESGGSKKVLDDKNIYRFDDKGNEIESASYGADGELMTKSLYKYDDKGNEIESAFYGADGTLIEESLYKYDDKGNKIESASYYADGKLSYKWLYKYDDRGNHIEWDEYDA